MLRAALCVTANLGRKCPLWVKSGHRSTSNQCLLCPQKRTLVRYGAPVAVNANTTARNNVRGDLFQMRRGVTGTVFVGGFYETVTHHSFYSGADDCCHHVTHKSGFGSGLGLRLAGWRMGLARGIGRSFGNQSGGR
jgi:hypothetical protein